MRWFRYTATLLVWLALLALLPPGSWGQAMLINGNRTHAGATNYGLTTGTGTAYLLTLNAAIPGYVDGSCYLLRIHTPNTGDATLNVNGKGATPLRKWVSGAAVALVAGDLSTGQEVQACYDTTGGPRMQVLSLGGGGGPGGGIATMPTAADQVLVSDSTSAGTWQSLPNCPDSGGNHLNYIIATNQWVCGTTGATVGSAAFSALTSGTNTAAAMVVGTGASLATAGAGTIIATSLSTVLPVSGGGHGSAPSADDQVFVSSSSSAGAWQPLPNCPDSGGNHLNYTIATNQWSCGITGTGGAPATASYLTTQAEAGLSAEANLGALTTGLLKLTVAGGIATPSTGTAGTDYAGLASTNVFTGRQDHAGAASTAANKTGTTLPATCIIGDTFFKSNDPAGRNIYGCTVANTWTLQGDGTGAAGTVTLTGVPTTNQAAEWSSSSSITGVNTTGTGNYVKANQPTMTVMDSTFTIGDNIDPTKQAQFMAGALTSGSPRTFTLPDFSSTLVVTANHLGVFAPTTSLQLSTVLNDETGSGLAVFNQSPTLVNPNLGTPSAINLGNASNLPATAIAGTLGCAQFPQLTGPITTPGNTCATTLAANSVGLTNLVDIATASILGRQTAGTGDPEVLSAAQAKTVLALDQVTNFAQLKRVENDFLAFPLKGAPVSGDLLLIEDSAGVPVGTKKYITIGSLPGAGGSTGISGGTANGAMYATGTTTGSSTSALTDGQVMLGRTGTTPVAGTIQGTTNQIRVTTGPGTLVLDFPPAGVTLPGTTTGSFSGALAGNATTATALSTPATDAMIPDLNTLSTGLAVSRCVQTNGTDGKLTVTAGPCTTGLSVSGTPTAGQLTTWINATTVAGVNTLDINYAASTVNSSGTVSTGTEYVTTGGAGVTRTLPSAASPTSTRRYLVLKVDNGVGALTLAAFAGQTLSTSAGAVASVSTTTQWAGWWVYETSNTNWFLDPVPGGGGAGTVGVSGTPALGELAEWTNPTTIKGTSTLGLNITDFDVSTSTRTRPNKVGTTAPGTCAVGDTFYDSDATAGFNIQPCTATNVFTDPVAASPTWTGTHTFNNNPKLPGFSDVSGTAYARLVGGYVHVGNNKLAFGPTVAGGSDLVLMRVAVRNVRLGDDDVAAPGGQTLSTQNAAVGTDRAGGFLSIIGSLGTGNGLPGIIDVKAGAYTPTSGSAAQASVSRATFGKVKPLTDGTATTVESLPLATNTMIGGIIEYTIVATNGTDHQSATGQVYYSAVNKAGVITATVAYSAATGGLDPIKALSAGTLGITWTLTAANPALLQVNADTSLAASTGYPYITYALKNFGQQ